MGWCLACNLGVKERDICCRSSLWLPLSVCLSHVNLMLVKTTRRLSREAELSMPDSLGVCSSPLCSGGQGACVATCFCACNSASHSAAGTPEFAAEDERRRSRAGEAEKRGR